MTIADIRSQLVTGKAFTFSSPGRTVPLVVASNDGRTLVANVQGKAPDQIIWSLEGLIEIPEITA